MQTRRRELFTTIRTEGAILPPDLLQRLAEGERELEGLTPASYHLAAHERLNEVINRSWNRLVGAWAGFVEARERLPEADIGTTLTRERWLQILFQELGYGRLQTERAVEIEGRSYPVSHAWSHTPIHLVGFRVPLDRRTAGVAGAATHSPHGLVQELLNRSDERLWGFVSNGLTLRVLRDNSSLTRQAFVEFDLQGMMDDEVYSDFVVLWLLCHESRVEDERPEECWLERWSQLAAEQGTRALEGLRAGVEEAINALGSGFLAHSANGQLRDALRGGELTPQDYYRELLRLVYRLLFLFVADDRGLLLDPAADQAARDRYERFYSTRRLRQLAERRRGGKHHDLYEAVKLVAGRLGDDSGCPELALPALGSFLWSKKASPDLDSSLIHNGDLLNAVRALALVEDGNVSRGVDYKNLGSEELGSVYESLLELHPELNVDAGSFALTTASGHERKTTGSYYTPTSLITVLLDSALDPVLYEAANGERPEQAILELKVCDPACGSGHFLVAAAHRIAKQLASVRTSDEEPAPEAVRTALRDVVSHCLYGVDVNPMAVELCKVALWLEALEPGRPLSFLDAHIKCGNSLLGTTPELLAAGIPNDAFNPIEGDDRESASALKRRNKQEREGQLTLEDELAAIEAQLAAAAVNVEAAADDSIAALHAKEQRFRDLVASESYLQAKLLADAWCAAFVQRKTDDVLTPITSGVLRRLAHDPSSVSESTLAEIQRLAAEYRFFHWHVEYPAAFDSEHSGFDIVLGNPPWERVKLQEKEFFAGHPAIAGARNAAQRKRLIAALAEDDPPLHKSWLKALRQADGESHLIRDSGCYPLCGRGDINTYSIFAELMRSLIAAVGRVGCIVPLGIATDDTTKHYFSDVVGRRSLVSLFGFENEEFIFPGIDHRVTFGLLTITGHRRPAEEAEFVFFARQPSALADPDRRFTLAPSDFALLNPNTGTCPIFRTARDAELTKAIYRKVPVLVLDAEPAGDAWSVPFGEMVHMSNDSASFLEAAELERAEWHLDGNTFHRGPSKCLPLYEAKMTYFFDHRFGTYEGQSEAQAAQGKLPESSDEDHRDPTFTVRPHYWLPEEWVDKALEGKWEYEWLLGWRKIVRNTDQRTFIPSILPKCGFANSGIAAFPRGGNPACLLANLSAFCFDYVARQKLAGTNMAGFITKQLPAFPPGIYAERAPWDQCTLASWITARVLELAYTAYDVRAFAADIGYSGPPFVWDGDRRRQLRAELDAAFFYLYRLDRDDVSHVMDSFWVVRDRDVREYDEFLTKRLILERYDALTDAVTNAQPYLTVLDPPPADRRVAHAQRKDPEGNSVVVQFPFRRLAVRPHAASGESLAPIYTLRAAAGAFGAGEAVDPDGWAELDSNQRLGPGMFVAQVRGHSMEPRIPDGAWCLFASPVTGSRDGRILLVEHRTIDDPDNGGSYTVKRYRSQKAEADGQLWQHEEILLEPLNPDYDPIVLKENDGEIRVVAELVEVLG